MARPLDYLYIVATIVFTVYGQLILKWRIGKLGALPPEALAKLKFLVMLLFDPAIFSGFAAAFLASLAWMAAMTRFELSHAYPFMSMNFVIVVLLSGWLLSEPLTWQRLIGVGLIVAGTVVAARG
ncbi:4-amino-4-deoxy-L-arabinose-phosphoundecaprenol flippase subunit ArnE [Xanthomonas hydrangeae]|uniref:EamA family transporter n=1 Tax=Xanthomonas hydrangeae TaxID=2775159 RepID=A0AAU0B741_9XANT|nr:EamA family transporter [Xanthomonas hydrangeae]WOB48004.1 EamA family transporter [Xanthomonas hydrangeae]CAD7725927.1 4-amino-4-deoxy-L-arabinose-phosphoundecaprenol flippase subunit ArnE [Xanthomonas hydrangeae]CAD7725931.1 4-amino-4-deoxy-L-arabinose-phosphoundecaprenol flippase subunit ArnE [Xanthomonas hydrangeae]CAD7734991.1 4-amino-4-deoxy-L-arabinose-phosphoundecaprenol flippase subunit ArnE [Xanthomonas hydrangeae]CAD7734994.1 4-amino-4-deoxy-L-arabinose-phosphoundecaprenol flippa